MTRFIKSIIVIALAYVLLGCSHTTKPNNSDVVSEAVPKRTVAENGALSIGTTVVVQSDVNLQSGRGSQFAKAFTGNVFSCVILRPSFLKPEFLRIKKDQRFILDGIRGLVSGVVGNSMHSVLVCEDDKHGDTTKPSCLRYGSGIEQNYIPGAVQYLVSFQPTPITDTAYGIDIQCNSLDLQKVLGTVFKLQ